MKVCVSYTCHSFFSFGDQMIGDGERKNGSAAGSLFQEAVQYLYSYNGAFVSKINANTRYKEKIVLCSILAFQMAPKPLGTAGKGFVAPTAKYRVAAPIGPPPQPLNFDSLPEKPSVRILTKYSPRLALDRKYPANKKLLPCPPPKNSVGIDLEGYWIVKAFAKKGLPPPPPPPSQKRKAEETSSSSANPKSSKQKVAHKPAD